MVFEFIRYCFRPQWVRGDFRLEHRLQRNTHVPKFSGAVRLQPAAWAQGNRKHQLHLHGKLVGESLCCRVEITVLVAISRAMRLRLGYGFDFFEPEVEAKILRCQRLAKRQKPKPCETKAVYFSNSSVGSQESWLKCLNEGNFTYVAIQWLSCNTETLWFMCPRCTWETDGIAAKLLRCGMASEALGRN